MEETIELRELIETVWKGKWIIAGLIAVFVFAAAILSWFVLPEKYESKAYIQVASGVQDSGIISSYVAAEFTPVIFTQRIGSEAMMNEVFAEAGINKKSNSKNFSASMQESTGLIELTYKAKSAEEAHNLLTSFISKTKAQMNTSVKNTLNELEKTYALETNKLSDEIEILIEQYNNIVISNRLPEILIMQTLVNSQIIMTVGEEQVQALTKVNGALHNELMQMQAQVSSKSAEYRLVLDKYQSVKTGLDSFRPDPFVRSIVDPTIPEVPSGPAKILNIAIAMIIGLMGGLSIVFFRQYWKNSAIAK